VAPGEMPSKKVIGDGTHAIAEAPFGFGSEVRGMTSREKPSQRDRNAVAEVAQEIERIHPTSSNQCRATNRWSIRLPRYAAWPRR